MVGCGVWVVEWWSGGVVGWWSGGVVGWLGGDQLTNRPTHVPTAPTYHQAYLPTFSSSIG